MKEQTPNNGTLNIYKASKMLQQKVGAGPLDEAIVAKSQKVLDENDVDFTPLGLEFLGKLANALKQANDDSIPMKTRKQALTAPVMELKANASIFKYNLIGNLANIMLSFLESTPELDKDAITIVDAHHKTLNMIVVKKMKGDGGEHGEIFMRELKDACTRYHTARAKKQS
jgi:hypothetical protein